MKRRHTANHTACKCVCEIINSIAKLCQIEKGTQMGFRTVHYLDCLLRTESRTYSVYAMMSHLLKGRQLVFIVVHTVHVQLDRCEAKLHTSALFYSTYTVDSYTNPQKVQVLWPVSSLLSSIRAQSTTHRKNKVLNTFWWVGQTSSRF